jgi:hypothetical protein
MPSMVQTTKASLMDAICTSDEMSDGKMDRATMRWGNYGVSYIRDCIMNADMR